MKKTQLLSILILSGTIAFGAKATALKAQVNFQESLSRVESTGSMTDLVIASEGAIHGLQFDISYNSSEIKSITPQAISGFEVKYNELSDGLIRGLVFSLQGLALPERLPFKFDMIEGFDGNSTVEFKDIILADPNGNGVEVEAYSYVVRSSNSNLPTKTGLTETYPNPFNPSSTINYGLKYEGHVEIMVYDATGRLVDELVNQHQIAGYHSITWNASSQASGMYFAKMVAGDVVQTQKLVLLK